MNDKYAQIVRFAAEHANRARLIKHETAIVDLVSAASVFDVSCAAATYVVEAKEGVFAVVALASGHLRWRPLGRALGLRQIHLAAPDLVKEYTGYDVGTVGPLFLNIPMYIDRRLLAHDMVYCGTEDAHHTLAIDPQLIVEQNNVAGWFDGGEFEQQ
ncbi:Aminoacyl-tRNA editing domain-containing protein [Bifidobacterium goeldii]|uniref:Aminoacyl-tRNA editing domain-containing protein n=1 Tax=Bifidobacterium goeldii TaxID=2306975 RepID=A0A430FLD3_9BIFI|nr:YbaK/EbsC family protein [Bifidobacterium goeldii]RSX53713.1 Aminoacyl-tRNA editing domain-containing protein [Bifidobacterium goeldii]